MKKATSILTVILIVAAMLRFSVAHHYCGGELVASKLTLSGATASCGMESEGGNCGNDGNGDQIKSHCCDDVITSYSIDNNYPPNSKALFGFNQLKFQTPVISVEKPEGIAFIINRLWSDISPPGKFPATAVDLPQIRVFRI